jgi:glycosyltransferase involved in cell wall biosynthesis
MSDSSLPLVSVVIPTYNRCHLVTDALDSVAQQSWRPLEIMVVDDGSDDNTVEIVDAWAKVLRPGVSTRLIRQSRQGANAARNRGVDESAGVFVAFLDSDDIWHPDKIRRQMAILAERPDFGAVYCGVREVDLTTGKSEEERRAYPDGELLDQLLVRDVTAPTSTCVVRRSVFEAAGGFDGSLPARQDWDLWIRISQHSKIGVVPDLLVDLRNHAGPRTASDPTRELRAHRQILCKYRQLRRERSFLMELRALASFHRRAGRVNMYYLRRPFRALAHYSVSVAVWPFSPDSYAAIIGWFLPVPWRRALRRRWNRAFGHTSVAIKSH